MAMTALLRPVSVRRLRVLEFIAFLTRLDFLWSLKKYDKAGSKRASKWQFIGDQDGKPVALEVLLYTPLSACPGHCRSQSVNFRSM